MIYIIRLIALCFFWGLITGVVGCEESTTQECTAGEAECQGNVARWCNSGAGNTWWEEKDCSANDSDSDDVCTEWEDQWGQYANCVDPSWEDF